MTLDEAIKHCWKRVDENIANGCKECAADHEQLAEWLRELHHLRNVVEYLRNAQCISACYKGENMNVIDWAENMLRRENNNDIR